MNLETQSYTVSTALTGVAFFAMRASLHGQTVDDKNADRATATSGVKWLLQTIEPSGNIPGHFDGRLEKGNESIPYSTEGIIAAELLLPGGHVALTASRINATVRFLVRNQRAQGGWFDAHSPRSLSLLQWYYQAVDQTDASVNEGIARYFAYLRRVGVRSFGRTELCCDVVQELGFLGLALADAVGPWASWRSLSAIPPPSSLKSDDTVAAAGYSLGCLAPELEYPEHTAFVDCDHGWMSMMGCL